ncbi:MAG: hypothetical protein LBO72_06355 [Helicobacteraceae bacterium]|jgi:hypothetical protein|nr:hypothetical protein [Helicobacteraceae bacterium]
MLNSDRLLPIDRAVELFGFAPDDLRAVKTLSLEGREVIYLADAARIYLKLDNENRAADQTIKTSLLNEESAARAVSLTRRQLRKLRTNGAITPPAWTLIAGSEQGKGRRVYLYDLQELVAQIKRFSGVSSIDQWFEGRK